VQRGARAIPPRPHARHPRTRRPLAWAAVALGAACAGTPAVELPRCAAQPAKPAPETACELSGEVREYRQDAASTLWGYIGPTLRTVPVALDFDRGARVETACFTEEPRGVRVESRRALERSFAALRGMRRAPACLAGTRLDLAEDFAAEKQRWRGRRVRSAPLVETRCIVQSSCNDASGPVCATLNDGSWAPFRSECAACDDPAVIGYRRGPCS
jgi:hypothetical protein